MTTTGFFPAPNGPETVLTKDLLRVSRRGGGYRPEFVGADHEQLAARVIGCYQGHVGESRGDLQEALERIERDSDDFKLVRGFAKLLDREATWEVQSPVEPRQARRVAFETSESVGVVTETERERALARAAERVGATAEEVRASLYADLERRESLTGMESRWRPDQLVEQYNLSLAQTALFDATEVRMRTDDPTTAISAVKRLRLLYEVRTLPESERRTVADTDREVVVTGPDALFRATRRYGTRFARLLRTLAGTTAWRLDATVDDRGTEREFTVTDEDVSVPGVDPVAEVSYDSSVEESFARRFASLDLEWELVREPDPVAAGEHVVVPDFALDWAHSDFRVYFEVMGFWTPEYVEKKLSRLAEVDETELLVAVDESLGVGEAVEARDHRAIPYSGQVNVGDVRGALRRYEEQLVERATAKLPEELHPEEEVVTLETVADHHGVTEAALEAVSFPDHERVGRTLVRPTVLATLADELGAGMAYESARQVLDEYGIDDASAVLSAVGYRVEWEGLSGGVLRERDQRA